jgi:SAM-dependent methyltransferase
MSRRDPRGHGTRRQRHGERTGHRRSLAPRGATARGVDWNSPESQELRFQQLERLFEDAEPFTINDYGCGYGAFAVFLRRRGGRAPYCGFDISMEMLAAARRVLADVEDWRLVDARDDMPKADYTIASGIFNVKLDTPDRVWQSYVDETLEHMAALSRRGFAFNMLTGYADADRMRPDLYYADPHAVFDRCRRFSRRVALLHDYPLYEFTMLVRLS